MIPPSWSSVLDPEDLSAGDDKARTALQRFVPEPIEPPLGRSFDEAYDALDAEFGVRGELERRGVIRMWLERGAGLLERAPDHALWWRYHLLVARDATSGAIAATRDCHVIVDTTRGIGVVYLAHTLVVPTYRRSGLGALLRAIPVTLGRRGLGAAGVQPPHGELLLAAEMEPAEPTDSDSVIRLVAYGRNGFAAIPARYLPYCQPDFRDLAALEHESSALAHPQPLPLLAIVRHVGHDDAGDVPIALAEAFVTHLYAVFATHCRAQDLSAPRAHALQTLAASGMDRIPLDRLPATPDDRAALEPLSRRAVLQFHAAETKSG